MSNIFTFILLLLCSGFKVSKGQDINECTSGTDDCVDGATCVNTDGSFTCTCPSGFTGDGRRSTGNGCADIDECTSGSSVCARNADCFNTPPGSFTCTCRDGFTGDGTSQCTDINECTSGTDDCVNRATCVNTDGSFTCTCPSGFTGDGRESHGNGCADIDECNSGFPVCVGNADCFNTPGSFTCTCRDGFTGDGTSRCTDIDECTSGTDDCVDGATCDNTPLGSFTCTCPPGFTGDGRTGGSGCEDIDECTEDPDNCEDGFSCVNTIGSFRCNDIDECNTGTPVCVDRAVGCVNTDGSFTCTCPPGFTGDGRRAPDGNGCTDSAVRLMFQGDTLSNNTELLIGDIGELSTGSAILCTTNRMECCRNPNLGEWYYPNGSVVPNNAAGYSFYRGRGDNQTIWLNRRNNAQSPNGSFCCELPDSSSRTHTLCANLVPVIITESGNNVEGQNYQLTCKYASSVDTPTFSWLGPGNSPLPSDVMIVNSSSGSTHISMLEFNPLQSSHEGSYTCQVSVAGGSVFTRSININVIMPVTTTTTELPTTRLENEITGGSDNTDPTMNDDGTAGANNGSGGNFSTVVSVSFGLVVIILSGVVAVNVIVCVAWRRHSTRNKNKDTSFNMAPNTSYGPVKSSKEMVESEYEDMKTGNEVYEEIPPATVTFDLATNVAYGPIQRDNDIIITSGTTLYDEVTTPAAATGESQYEAL